jgi:hypothetical protein
MVPDEPAGPSVVRFILSAKLGALSIERAAALDPWTACRKSRGWHNRGWFLQCLDVSRCALQQMNIWNGSDGSFTTDAFNSRADQMSVVTPIATLLFGAAK